jgi:predicted dehydrogenase
MSNSADLTRRDAVKLAGAAGVAAAASQVQGAPWIQTVKAANNQMQYGVVGTGGRGSYLLKHLQKIDNGRCVAVCDIQQAAMDKAAQVIGTNPAKFKDYRELLSQKNVDAVIVAVPLYMHFPVTRDTLLAGKHVLCEKSLVFKPEEVHALRTLVAEHPKQVLQVGLQRRYSLFYQAVRQMIDKGMLGKVTHVHAQWHRNPGWVMKQPAGPGNPANWRLYRQFSGGMTAELASHQIDIADWMFGATPEWVMGVGGLDTWKDGRDIYDNIQLIYMYPGGRKLIYSGISTNAHLPYLGSSRPEFGECIMGTEASVEITVGDGEATMPTALWYKEAKKPTFADPKDAKAKKDDVKTAGATFALGAGQRGLPLLLDKDQVTGKESFLDREMKFARRWLYSKGVMVSDEPTNPVETELESFFNDCRRLGKPKANLEIGLADSIAVMLSNKAMDEDRRVHFNEIDKMGKGPEPKQPAKPGGKKG